MPRIDEILEQYEWLVGWLVNRWDPRDYLRDDLLQQGRIGLWKAAQRFRPERGVAFTTYAVPLIRGEMLHWIRNHLTAVRIPRELWERRDRARMVSLDAMLEDAAGEARVLPADCAVEEVGFARAEASADLARLPRPNRTSLYLYYLAGWTQTEIAAQIGMSQKHVSRMVRGRR